MKDFERWMTMIVMTGGLLAALADNMILLGACTVAAPIWHLAYVIRISRRTFNVSVSNPGASREDA